MKSGFLRRVLLGGVCCFCLTLTGHANIVFIGGLNIDITPDFGGVYLDLQEGAVVETGGGGAWDINPFFGGTTIANVGGFQPVRTAMDSASPVVNLSVNDVVNGSSTFAEVASVTSGLPGRSGETTATGHMAGGTSSSPFTNGVTGYIGFAWDHDANDGTLPRYGFIEVTLYDDGSTGTVHAIGYETDPGVGILVGIPEPASALLAVLGAAGFLFRRRR